MSKSHRGILVLLLLLSSCVSGSRGNVPCAVTTMALSPEPLRVRTGYYEISATVRLKGCRSDLAALSASQLEELRKTMKSLMTEQEILLFAIVRDDGLRHSKIVDPLNASLPASPIEDVEVEGGFAESMPRGKEPD